MPTFSVRVSDDLLARFDAWAGDHGGRAPALRRLMIDASAGSSPAGEPLATRPLKLTVRLSERDGRGLAHAAQVMGLTPNAWAAAVIRRRLHGKPTFGHREDMALIAVQAELRRLGVNLNQIARSQHAAGPERPLDAAFFEALRTEIRGHMLVLREAFEGNLAYWEGAR
jgi:hypothetical protein